MLAYLNDPAVKAKYLDRVKQHREADELVQSYGYWEDGKGCAVGCTLHGDQHRDYETELGIPERLAYLEDAIFEGLPVDLAKQWPERFLAAIKPGADLSKTWTHFTIWMLRDSELLTVDMNREAIAAVIDLHVKSLTADVSESAAWSAAWSAAYVKMSDKLIELLQAD